MDSTTNKIVSRDPGVMSGELVSAGTRVEVKTHGTEREERS